MSPLLSQRSFVALGAIAAILSTASLGFPQSARRRTPPSRNLFGLVLPDTDRLLALNVALGGGYDANVSAGEDAWFGGTYPRDWISSSFADASGDLYYMTKRRNFDFQGGFGASVRRYSVLTRDFVTSEYAAADATARFGRRTQLLMNGSGRMQPYYPMAPFGAVSEPAPSSSGVGYGPSSREGTVVSSAVTLSQILSRPMTLSGTYEYRSTNYSGASLDSRWQTAGARLARDITRNSTLRLGYRYENGWYGSLGDRRTEIHNIDSGIDYNRSLSSSKRTLVAFAAGAALIRDRDEQLVRLTGRARLGRQIGRTWLAAVAYRHEVGFVQMLPAPATSDALEVGADGWINRRLQLRLAGRYTNGSVGLTGSRNAFELVTGTAALSASLSRHAAVSAEFFYDRYWFGTPAVLPPGWSREMNRPGIRIQLTTWFPLYERERRVDADR